MWGWGAFLSWKKERVYAFPAVYFNKFKSISKIGRAQKKKQLQYSVIRIKNGKNTMCNGKTEERYLGFPGEASSKEPVCQCRLEERNAGGHGNPLQYSCLESPMDRGAWQATVHRVAQSDMTEGTLRRCTCRYMYMCLYG